jgi:hypothetical protein
MSHTKKQIVERIEEMVSGLVSELFRHERAQLNDRNTVVSVPNNLIPKGCRLVECYETEKEFVIIGRPDPDDESHNCDALGCSSVAHVIARFRKEVRR